MTTGAAVTTGAPDRAAWSVPRAVLGKAAILVAVLLVPAAIAAVLGGALAAVGVTLGLIAGLGAGMLLRPLPALGVAALNVVAAGMGSLVAGEALASAMVVGLFALAVGPANRRGLGRAVLLLPMLAAIAASGAIAGDPARGLAGLAVGAAWAIVVCARVAPPPAPVPLPFREAWTHALVLAATTSVATYLTLALPLPHGYWIVVTLTAVLVPTAHEQAAATAERVGGTILGALVGVFAAVLLPPVLLAALIVAGLLLTVSYALLHDGRRKVMWMTVVLVLALGGGTTAVTIEVAAQRLAWTLAGAALVIAAALVVRALDRPVEQATGAA